MRKHLSKIILLTIYPYFLWAGSAFLDAMPDTKTEAIGSMAIRFSELAKAADAHEFIQDRSSKLVNRATDACNGYPQYLRAAYKDAADASVKDYMRDLGRALANPIDRAIDMAKAIELPGGMSTDFAVALYLRWGGGGVLKGGAPKDVIDGITAKISTKFPGLSEQSKRLWAAVFFRYAIDTKKLNMMYSFSGDIRPIMHAYNPVLAAAARARPEAARATESVVPAAAAGGAAGAAAFVDGKGASGEDARASLLDTREEKPAAGAGVAAASGSSARSVEAASSTEASAVDSTAVAGVAAALAGPAAEGSAAASTLRRRDAAEEIESGQASVGDSIEGSGHKAANSGGVTVVSKQDPPAPRCKLCTMF